MIEVLTEIQQKISNLAHNRGPRLPSSERLPAISPELTQFFEGGLRWGDLIEWGMPWGKGCRDLIHQFLQSAHRLPQPNWCLWIYEQQDLSIYPPAWQARGVNLSYMRFAASQQPIHDLKPVLVDPFFKLIVFDCSDSLSLEDCHFLAHQARRHRQIIFVLRNYYLSPNKGNVWAKARVNCWYDPLKKVFSLTSVKGIPSRQVTFKKENSNTITLF